MFKSWVMQVTWTTWALSLRSLMNTAVAGAWDAAVAKWVNYIMICPEWAIRYTLDGWTPTAAIGMVGANTTQFNNTYAFEGNLNDVIIIWAVKVNIQVGFISH
jgi:hypothetical protein